MKVISRATNKVATLIVDGAYKFVQKFAIEDDGGNRIAEYDSIEALYRDFKDYEEPKEYYAIDLQGDIIRWARHSWDEKTTNKIKAIGNYFGTEEEAEKAAEKLKCFSNLKNHEFMFDGWYYGTDGNIVILANAHEFNDMEEQDLTKVFGEKIC